MTIKKKMLQAAAGFGVDVAKPFGVDFDGTNDYLSRASDLVGNADGKTFTFSAWVYLAPDASSDHDIYSSYTGAAFTFRIYHDSSNKTIQVRGLNTAGSTILNIGAGASKIDVPRATWYNILMSMDLSSTSLRHVYVSDSLVSPTYGTYTNDNLNFTNPEHYVGTRDTGFGEMYGRLAGVYLDYTYRDLSVEANRRDFIDADGLYVTPPTSGIISVPMDDPDDVDRNDGTGGDFTLNGTVARSGRGPNQYNAVASTFDGSADYLSRGALTGVADSKVFTLAFSAKKAATATAIVFGVADTAVNYGLQVQFTANTIKLFGKNSSNTLVLNVVSDTLTLVDKYLTVNLSMDTSDSAKTRLYINGQSISVTHTTLTDSALDFTRANAYVGYFDNPTYFSGDISDLYFDTSYIDLATENPFYDVETNKPKYLGASGELPTGSSPLIYLPLRADDAGNNLGTGGDFTVNSGPYVGARGASEFLARSVELNGTSQLLKRTSALTGASDSKVFSCSFFMRPDGTNGFTVISPAASGDAFRGQISVQGSGLRVSWYNSAGSSILDNSTPSSFVTTGQLYHVLICVDMTDEAKSKVYIDGVDSNETWTKFTDDNLTFTADNMGIGARPNATPIVYFDGNIGFLYLSTEYIDFSQEANRLKFVDGLGYPVDLGADGSAPTGSQPLIYMNNDIHLGTNLGSGGDFTPINSPTAGADVKG
tara:strand:- start:1145 stop:3268 length:2124 start_codon:yes stop_codon:yes gene_type:complete